VQVEVATAHPGSRRQVLENLQRLFVGPVVDNEAEDKDSGFL